MPEKTVETIKNDSSASASRLEILRRKRRALGLSFILITDPVDVAYISGFLSTNAALLISSRTNYLLTDFRYHGLATEFCTRRPEWIYRPINKSMAETIASYLTKESVVGFQSDRFVVDDFQKLKRRSRGVRFTGIGAAINEILCVKRSDEISAMKRAARIGDRAFGEVVKDLQPGITEQQLARRLDRLCLDLGSQKPSFDTIVLFGEHSALPHGIPGKKKLKRGDLILIDFGCTVDGFCSDMTRTVILGPSTARQRQLYEIVRDAQLYARKNARPGMSARAIDALARGCIEEKGYGDAFGHALGHGVGRRIHEAPRISMHETALIREKTVFTIEPGIYLPEYGGIRIEDMVVMEQQRARLLTHSPRELIEL